MATILGIPLKPCRTNPSNSAHKRPRAATKYPIPQTQTIRNRMYPSPINLRIPPPHREITTPPRPTDVCPTDLGPHPKTCVHCGYYLLPYQGHTQNCVDLATYPLLYRGHTQKGS